MEVAYELTPEDIWHNSLYYRQKSVIRPVFLHLLAGLLGLLAFLGFGLVVASWLMHGRVDLSIVPWSCVLLFWLVRLLPPTKGEIIKRARRRPGLLCEHTIAISPQWFSEKTAVNETKVAWKTLHSIEEDAEYQFFFIAKSNAYIVPKRAFSSLAEAQAFLDTSRKYWEAAKAGQTASSDDTGTWPPPPQSVKRG